MSYALAYLHVEKTNQAGHYLLVDCVGVLCIVNEGECDTCIEDSFQKGKEDEDERESSWCNICLWKTQFTNYLFLKKSFM